MATHKLYFVPLSSITATAGLIQNLDSADPWHNGKTFEVNGPTSQIIVNDSTDGTFQDDGHFSNQTLAEAWNGFNAGAGVEVNYMYVLSAPGHPTIQVYSVAIHNSANIFGAVQDQIQGFVSTGVIKQGVTYTVTGARSITNPGYSSLVPCFAAGTEIETEAGPRRVETLRAGDRVLTRDNGAQEIRWSGQRKLSAADLEEAPNLRPIRICRCALGPGVPERDLVVSPQHRVLVRSKIVRNMFDHGEVLVAAKQLLAVEGIEIAEDIEEVCYCHILFDRHEVVRSNGAETESLYTGPEALKAVGEEARDEILTLFPELKDRDYRPQGARIFAIGKKARHMAERHIKNQKALVA